MKQLTELQFWQKAKKAFEKPSLSEHSECGLCLYLDYADVSKTVENKILNKIWKEKKRLNKKRFLYSAYIDNAIGRRSESRIRFINRMIRQCKAKGKK